MWSGSDFRTAGAIIGLIGVVLKVFWYFLSSRPNETYQSFKTRMEFGEFTSPAIRTRMEQDPESRARMEALLRSRAFRKKAAEVESTRSSLRSAIEDAKNFSARVKDAKTVKQSATEMAAARETNDDAAVGDGDESDAVAEAGKRLLEVARDEANVKARVVVAAAKHQAAKAVVVHIIMAVAQGRIGAREPGRTPATRAGAAGVRGRGGAVAAAAGGSGRAARGAGAAATVEPMEIPSANDMEEGSSLL